MRRMREMNETIHNQYQNIDYKIERLRLTQVDLTRNVSQSDSTLVTMVTDLERVKRNQTEQIRASQQRLASSDTRLNVLERELRSLQNEQDRVSNSVSLVQSDLSAYRDDVNGAISSRLVPITNDIEYLRRNQSEPVVLFITSAGGSAHPQPQHAHPHPRRESDTRVLPGVGR